MTTVSLFAPELSGTTGLILKLTKPSDYSAVNGSGDPLTESGSTGWFSATVDEPWTEKLAAAVVDGDGLIPRSGWLGVESTLVADVTAEVNAAGASGGDWTNTEKAQIRYRLGLEGTATAPPEPDVDPIVITPATGIMTTGYLVTRVKGVPTAAITIRYQQAQEPAADRGSSYDDTVYSAVSNSEGIAELSLVKGGLYYVWRSSASRPMNVAAYRVLKADGTTPDATLALPSHVGA